MQTYLPFIIGLIPLVLLILFILQLKISIHVSTLICLAITTVLAACYWHTSVSDLSQAIIYGILKGLWPIVIIILAAIFSYNLMLHTKSMDVLRNLLANLSDDSRIQVLLIAWCFGGFLEATAGYGTAVAIPIGILMALGFDPIKSSVAALVANTVPTAFGAIGIPVSILAEQVNIDVIPLSTAVITQLALFNILLPFVIVAIISGTPKAIKGVAGITLLCGISTLVPQYYVATHLGAELPAFAGSLVSLLVVAVAAKWRKKSAADAKYRLPSTAKNRTGYSWRQILNASCIYLLILFFILACSPLFPAVKAFLAPATSTIHFSLAATELTLKIEWLATPGVLILIASFIGGIWQGAKPTAIVSVLWATVKQLRNSMLAIPAIVAMATVMDISGLIADVASVIVLLTGGAYIFIAPVIGALGTFVTGSDTNSNVLFGKLQTVSAAKLGLDPTWLAAANTAGATGGKMISPQSISIAVAAAKLEKQSNQIMLSSGKYCLLYILILGLKVGLIYHLFIV